MKFIRYLRKLVRPNVDTMREMTETTYIHMTIGTILRSSLDKIFLSVIFETTSLDPTSSTCSLLEKASALPLNGTSPFFSL